MKSKESLDALFRERGYTDYKWIKPEHIVVSQWVRMKCTFGCLEYGKNASCPPNTPPVPECARFFGEYGDAVVFHFETTVEHPEDRFAWTKEINNGLVDLERDVFVAGHRKAFMLVMDSCYLCEECAGTRTACRNMKRSRPAPEAMAVDVFATVQRYGYPIEVLPDYTSKMNRYAILMVE